MTTTNPILTDAGRSLLIRASAGETITFTRFGIGNGSLGTNQDPATFTALLAEKHSFAISEMQTGGEYVQVQGEFSTDMIDAEFMWRELGLFARGEDGMELLYAYANYGDEAGLIKSRSTSAIAIQTIDLQVLVGSASHVTALTAPAGDYAPRLHAHVIDEIASAGQYTGDGKVKRMISLPFTPSVVYLCTDLGCEGKGGVCGGLALKGNGLRAADSVNANHAAIWSNTYTALMITDGGFLVNYRAGSIATNENGVVYHYIAYR